MKPEIADGAFAHTHKADLAVQARPLERRRMHADKRRRLGLGVSEIKVKAVRVRDLPAKRLQTIILVGVSAHTLQTRRSVHHS